MARSRADRLARSRAGSYLGSHSQELPHRLDHFLRGAHMGTVLGCIHDHEFAIWNAVVTVFADNAWGNRVTLALQNQGTRCQPRQVGAIVRKKGYPSEVLGKERIRPAEAGLQFSRQI